MVISTYLRRVSFELSVAALLGVLGVVAALFASLFVVLGAAALIALYSVLIKGVQSCRDLSGGANERLDNLFSLEAS